MDEVLGALADTCAFTGREPKIQSGQAHVRSVALDACVEGSLFDKSFEAGELLPSLFITFICFFVLTKINNKKIKIKLKGLIPVQRVMCCFMVRLCASFCHVAHE